MDIDKKKIGIVTLHGYHNYGNKLQNYALQFVIRTLGYETETLIITDKTSSRIKKLVLLSPKATIHKIIKKLRIKKEDNLHTDIISNRYRKFKEFSSEFIKEKYLCKSSKDFRNIINDYSYFVTGSDQVWNPIYINNMHNYFLTFADKSKRIAYAASFSCSNIPNKYRSLYKGWIVDMPRISVREKEGARIINDLTGISVPVLIDPTIILTKDQWLYVTKRAHNRPNDKYILTYFLGELGKDTKDYIQFLSKENDMKVICLGDINEKDTYETGPSEFIDYINSASLFLTDSFHGVVFSILLETPFIVYERKTKLDTMYSRIETLLEIFSLEYRQANNILGIKDLFSVDYKHVKNILNEERNKAMDFLKNALEEKDEL